jgi:hypothetical protein
MLKKAMFLTLALLVGVVASASAQSAQCTLGVYADEGGTQTVLTPIRDQGNPLTFIDVYYVMQVDDLVAGAAWYREVTGMAASTFTIDWESYGTFIDDRPEGWRIGLGECVLGYGGTHITLLKETLALVDDYQGGTGTIQVIPNTLQNSTGTAYTDCLGEVKPCGVGPALTIESVVPAPGKSFGAVKALYK